MESLKVIGIITDDLSAFSSARLILESMFKEFKVIDQPLSAEDADYVNLHDGLTIKILPSSMEYTDVDVVVDHTNEEDLYYQLEDTRKAYEEGFLS